jgi:hypothetical protein
MFDTIGWPEPTRPESWKPASGKLFADPFSLVEQPVASLIINTEPSGVLMRCFRNLILTGILIGLSCLLIACGDDDPAGPGGGDTGPLTLAELRALIPAGPSDPVTVDHPLESVIVTYVGSSEFFIQAGPAGPALQVYEGSGWVADVEVGDEISLTVTAVANWRGNQQITAHAPIGEPLSTANDVSGWVQDLGAGPSTPHEDFEHELVGLTGALVTAIAGGNEITISYGTVSDVPLVTSGYVHPDLCVGAVFDIQAVVTQFDDRHQITSWSSTDFTMIDTGGCAPALAPGDLVLNEVDYDNVGNDIAEFIEVHNTTGETLDLSNVIIVLYNGTTATEYKTVNLGGAIAAGGYHVVCNEDGAGAPTVTMPAGTPYTLMGISNQIQNGAPDGIALIDMLAGTVLDALSYEGEMTSVTHASVADPFSLVEGMATQVADNNTYDASLVRNPNGSDTDDAATDWAETTTLTPGAANVVTPP